MVMLPLFSSWNRGIKSASVDLPPPLPPTSATVSPLLMVRLMSFSTNGPSPYEKFTLLNSIELLNWGAGCPSVSFSTSAVNTSFILSSEAAPFFSLKNASEIALAGGINCENTAMYPMRNSPVSAESVFRMSEPLYMSMLLITILAINSLSGEAKNSFLLSFTINLKCSSFNVSKRSSLSFFAANAFIIFIPCRLSSK